MKPNDADISEVVRRPLLRAIGVCAAGCILTLATGCQTHPQDSAQSAAPRPSVAAPQSATSTQLVSPPAFARTVIRIKAGLSTPFTDSNGNIWQPDQGFEGGNVVDRDPGTSIANTKDPQLYLTEHYSMDAFGCKIPNGKYTAKLYFAETFESIASPGERVFSFNVQGQEFKDFDVWVKAGGPNRAYIETVPVEVTNGVFRILFTSKIENPEINAIELEPGK